MHTPNMAVSPGDVEASNETGGASRGADPVRRSSRPLALRIFRILGHSTRGRSSTKNDSVASALLSLLLTSVIAWIIVVYVNIVTEPKLELVANVTSIGDSAWQVAGRVVHNGRAISGVSIWASALDGHGNSFAPAPTKSDSAGSFQLPPIPRIIGPTDSAFATSISVRASAGKPVLPHTQERARTISLRPDDTYNAYSLPWRATFVIAIIFGISLLLALTQADTPRLRHTQYVALVGLAILMIGLVITSLTAALQDLEWTEKETGAKVISFGFAHAVKGTFIPDHPPEWVLSLTPVSNLKPEQLMSLTGLGAPLWTLLIAVLGASLFTISIVIRAVKEPPDTASPAAFQNRVQEIVLHQFYVVFAPLGSIFVYQLLLIAGAANRPAVVALAALASGVTLHLLLRRAINAVEVAFAQNDRPVRGKPASPDSAT